MGVKGLWQLLLPIGRRINIETLEGKILAIDASIWITQFIKAMRDPESGAVRPAAHIIGFFRRLCRLRFHGIRPVLVFDGATPEIKRREVMQRKKRRDQFVAKHGTAAVQRLAKRLLVEQLKKSKSKALVDSEQKVSFQKSSNEEDSGFASGFNPGSQSHTHAAAGEAAADNMNSDDKVQKNSAEQLEGVDLESDNARFEIKNGELIITSASHLSASGKSNQDNVSETIFDDENDWDKPIKADNDDSDDKEEGEESKNSNSEAVEYDDVLWTSRNRRKKQKKQTKSSSEEFFDPDYVLSLDPADRKDAIEIAKKKQRMKSRGEFMPVAADPVDYSQVQLRNFLRSSQLNKDIVSMAKRAVKVDSQIHGEITASDRTRRIVFEKDTDEPTQDRRDVRSSSESEEESDDCAFLPADKRPTHARRIQTKKQQGLVEKEKGKFFIDSPRRYRLRKVGHGLRHSANTTDSDSDAVESGGLFNTSSKHEYDFVSTKRKTRAILDDEDDDDSNGGGFMSSPPSNPARSVTTATSNIEDNDGLDGGEGCMSTNNLVRKVESIAAFGSSSRKLDTAAQVTHLGGRAKRPMSFKEIPYSTKSVKTVVGALFRSSTAEDSADDSSHDGGGFLRGNSIIRKTLLKSTGLDDDEVLIDDNDNVCNVTVKHNACVNDSLKVQEYQDGLIAKALQAEEDARLAASYAAEAVMVTGSEVDAVLPEQADYIITESINVKAGGFFVQMSNIHSSRSCNDTRTSAVLLEGGDYSEDDSIAWENGDVSGDENNNHKLVAGDLTAQENSKAASIESATGCAGVVETRLPSNKNPKKTPADVVYIDDDSDSSVEWEDGDSAGNAAEVAAKEAAEMTCYKEESPGIHQARPLQDVGGDSDEGETRVLDQDVSNTKGSAGAQSHGVDDFGGPLGYKNTEALQQAESTAASLTNWAGRAMRRAIAEHFGMESSGPKTSDKPDTHSDDSNVEILQKLAANKEEGLQKDENISQNDESLPKATVEQNLVVNEAYAEEAAAMLQNYQNELSHAATNNVQREIEGVTDEMEEEIMHLLQLFGVPYIRAPAEAEAQCVMLERLNLVDGIVTEDSDVFVFGGKTVYKNIFDDQKYAEVYKASDAEREMGLNQNAMVALAMLLGGDYTEGVRGVGIVNGMEVINAFDVGADLKGGLHKFRAWLDGFEPIVEAKSRLNTGAKKRTKEQKFHIKHRAARNRWEAPESFPSDSVMSAYVNPVVDKSPVKFSFGVPDLERMQIFCNKQIGWPVDETKRYMEPVIEKVQSKSRQTRIDSFMRYEHGIKFADIRSRRLRHVLGTFQNDDDAKTDSDSEEGQIGDKEIPMDQTAGDEVPPAEKKSRSAAAEQNESADKRKKFSTKK